MANRVDKVKIQIRTKLKGEALEEKLADHMGTLKERDRIELAKKAANKDFKEELAEKDSLIEEQRIVLDKGELETVEVEVVTGLKNKKTYRRLDTGENLDEDDIPEQMEILVEGEGEMGADD
jgi:hypothetical protein